MLIAITGGYGSGKSTVANVARGMDFDVIDTDLIVRQLSSSGTAVFKDIVFRFGKDVVGPDGELDRKRLADIVFNDPLKLSSLEMVVHPAVFAEVDKLVAEIISVKGADTIIFVEVPLLYETKSEKRFDKVITAYADPATMLARVISRDRISGVDAMKRITRQLLIDEKKNRADYFIDTRKPFVEISKEFRSLMEEIISSRDKTSN